MNKKELLGKRLRELRKRKGINQEKLAEMIEVDPTTISNIENGKNYPSLINLENLLNVLDSSFLEAFDFEHKNKKEDLLSQINEKLKNNPDKLEDFYKIVMALTK
ncbi:TPA: transcriptional regulator [Candidatus Gastranaerophilales bacterium HUM_10]|nr:MAG TPA: transcriptional regulator [Candidatus Gastranaerophilales bacterium HUM_10]